MMRRKSKIKLILMQKKKQKNEKLILSQQSITHNSLNETRWNYLLFIYYKNEK